MTPGMLLDAVAAIVAWGLVATGVMTTILHASQGLGFSRLSLPFLVGTFFTSRRSLAQLIGFLAYAFGGWLFAIVYLALFISMDRGNWWIGLLFGAVHGIVLLVVVLPLIPYIHPRMATQYAGPARSQRLEPPGFMGLNYGYRTPLSVFIALCAYGATLGLGYQLSPISTGL